jgi:hypothetical protein
METVNRMTVPTPLPQNNANLTRCPLCGGLMSEQRGQLRCGRCFFVVCQACDGMEIELAREE